MATLKSFSPEHLSAEAQESGFFQCPKCGLIWFGKRLGYDTDKCPEGHGNAMRVAIVCMSCDETVSVKELTEHLASERHYLSTNRHGVA